MSRVSRHHDHCNAPVAVTLYRAGGKPRPPGGALLEFLAWVSFACAASWCLL